MKFNLEKVVDVVVSVFAIGVGILVFSTVCVMGYAIIKTVFNF